MKIIFMFILAFFVLSSKATLPSFDTIVFQDNTTNPICTGSVTLGGCGEICDQVYIGLKEAKSNGNVTFFINFNECNEETSYTDTSFICSTTKPHLKLYMVDGKNYQYNVTCSCSNKKSCTGVIINDHSSSNTSSNLIVSSFLFLVTLFSILF
ncbi:hypothetical protein DICPUDRAFT_147642 [Dictyostelium purpureum]|uniref:Uncharacterized protein n=1 Tax=Dictyostelium purpureum TaxID=5786 RepID=F0Z910_DICPU|nr:uncharacterized protein DICPUDRAFT_147642 [Dictyostelium purpureum]EGC39578.1 hypothetical protein DICPUDRAFT_147642 [Dictyostelium purpureum]|eukprot:XP_003283913.1 hypothetical protein DICPUDRAFT_147642 [Dictyostelium purpureum]